MLRIGPGHFFRREQVCAAVCATAWAAACALAGAAAAPPTPRIVSLSPHITELLFAAGAGARIVGVDDASDYPPAALKIPKVGEAAALDIEGLLEAAPSIVILWESGTPPRARAELARLKLRLMFTEQRNLDDIGAALMEFGRLAGSSAVADEAARQYRADLAALRQRYRDRPRLKVFYQVWDRPLYTLSGEHVVSEVLSLCGGDNVFAALSTLAPVVDREAVLARNPDVILIGATGADGRRQVDAWNRLSSIGAVRDRHVYTLDPSLIGRMAPRILQGVQQVCSALDRARTRSDLPARNRGQSPDDNSNR
jgi:iron complex transport system substrate-binding protein